MENYIILVRDEKRRGAKNITLRRGGYQPPAGRIVCAPTDVCSLS